MGKDFSLPICFVFHWLAFSLRPAVHDFAAVLPATNR